MFAWGKNIQELVQEVDRCIRAQEDEGLTLRHLAQKLGYSEYHVSRRARGCGSPLPPSMREVTARSAGGGRDSTRFSLPQSAAPTAPSQRGPRSAALPR